MKAKLHPTIDCFTFLADVVLNLDFSMSILIFFMFSKARNLKNRVPVEAGVQFFYQIVFFACVFKRLPKINKKNYGFRDRKINQNRFRNASGKTSFFYCSHRLLSIFHRFWFRFGRSWAGLGNFLDIQNGSPKRNFVLTQHLDF